MRPETTTREASPDERLLAVLQDLIAADGRDAAARRLNLSERTLRRALANGQLSSQLRAALAPLASEAPELQAAQLKRELAALEQRTRALESGPSDEVPEADVATVSEQVAGLNARLQDVEQQLALVTDAVAELQESQQAAAVAAIDESEPVADYPRRSYPELVELEPQPDDELVYGNEVCALITDWREQHARFKAHWPSIAGYEAEIRAVELELRLITEHGLTMPPAELPWTTDWQRERAVQERKASLDEARRKLRRKRVRRFLLRFVTLGLRG